MVIYAYKLKTSMMQRIEERTINKALEALYPGVKLNGESKKWLLNQLDDRTYPDHPRERPLLIERLRQKIAQFQIKHESGGSTYFELGEDLERICKQWVKEKMPKAIRMQWVKFINAPIMSSDSPGSLRMDYWYKMTLESTSRLNSLATETCRDVLTNSGRYMRSLARPILSSSLSEDFLPKIAPKK